MKPCIVLGCTNDPVRLLVLKRSSLGHTEAQQPSFTLCAYHVRRAILYLSPSQIRDLVLPPDAH